MTTVAHAVTVDHRASQDFCCGATLGLEVGLMLLPPSSPKVIAENFLYFFTTGHCRELIDIRGKRCSAEKPAKGTKATPTQPHSHLRAQPNPLAPNLRNPDLVAGIEQRLGSLAARLVAKEWADAIKLEKAVGPKADM